MGDWTIVIEGTGEHDDPDRPNAIENLLRDFVKSLGGKQTVTHATVTTASRRNI